MGKDIFSKKSRFSIRKLNIGVCSVLLGTLIMIGHTAQADETTSDGATVAATAVSASQGEGVPAATSPSTASESVSTTTVTPAVTETVAATSVEPTSSAPANSVATSTSQAVASEATGSTNVSTAKPATASEVPASEASRSVTASTTSSTTASSEITNTNNITVSETPNAPRVRSRRSIAQGETRSSSTETRASDGAQNLDYSNKENVQDYVQISYEVDKANNVLHWTVLDNPGRKANSASGYVYFTIPKDSVGAPTNWNVVQTDKNGKVVNTRNYWKDNDGSYLMGQNGRMNTYTGAEMTKRLTQLYKDTKNPAIKGNEAAVAAQTAERSQALYTMTADNNALRNVMWTITFDTPIVDKSKPLDYVAGMQGTGVIGGRTNIMTGFTDNFIDNESSKFQAVAVKEKYTAKVGGSFDADPATYVTNKAGTPEFPNNYRGATTFAWKDGQAPTATQAGTYTKTVMVTYPAHYNQAPQEVTVTFEVEEEATPAPEITSDLSGKASTPADVTVKAPAGSTVKLYNNDGVVIGEAVANDQGVATITPTNSLPEGEVTATATPAGGSESAKSAPITVTKSPVTGEEGGLSRGSDNTQLLVRKSHITVYPGDPVNVDVIAAATAIEKFWVPKNPTAISGVLPVGAFLTTAGSNTYRQRNAAFQGTVAETQPAGDTVVTFAVKSKKNVTVTRDLKVTVLETAKKYDPTSGEAKVEVADVSNVSEAEKTKIIDAVKAANTSLPSSATYSVDEKGNLVITYADKSIDKIAAAYLVTPVKDPRSDAEKNDPTAKAQTVTPGSTPTAQDSIGNAGDLPSGTTFAFKKPVDTATEGEKDATVVVTYPDGTTDEVPVKVTVKDPSAPATDADKNTPVVKDQTVKPGDKPSAKDSIGNVDDLPKGTTVEFKTPVDTTTPGEKDATVVVTYPDGSKDEVPVKVTVKDPSAPATDADKNTPVSKDQTVKPGEKPKAEDSIDNLKDLPKGTTVAFKDPVDTTTPGDKAPTVVVTYPDGSKDEVPVKVTVKDPSAPAKPVVATDLTDKAGTKTPVEVSAEPGSKVELFDKDGNKIGEATADENGKATITPTVAIPAGNVTAKATDPAGNTSDASDPMVATTDTTAPAKPVVATDLTDKAGTKTPVEVSAEPGSTVALYDKDGNKIGEATADENGKATITPTVAIPAGNVTAKATDPAGNTSDASDPMVATTDTTAPAKPVANTVKAGDTAITGTAEAGSTVEVTLPDGSKVSAKADQDGNFSVPVSGLKEGDTVSVTATDDAGNTSNPTSVTVGKGTDTTAPSAPVVNPVKAGTTAVTGTAEAGSTVEVTLPDSSKVSAKADQDGNFSVPVSGLKEGDTVSVTATDDAGNTSNPTSVTVGKGTDTIAPDAPVVNTDLTGKAGTRTPIDVIAEPGSKVELFDKDGNKIGEATADETGLAVVVPTVNIPEGSVTARATDLAGNVSGASAPMFATTSGTVDSFNNGKGSENTPTVVKPSLNGKVESSTTLANHMNLKARANISSTEKDASTLPETGDEVSIGGVVLGGILAAAGLGLVGKRKKED